MVDWLCLRLTLSGRILMSTLSARVGKETCEGVERRRPKIAALVVMGTILSVASIARTANVTVDCDAGGSIRAALDRVKPGDMVLVSGTCNENVVVAAELQRITLDGQGKAAIKAPSPASATVAVTGREIAIKGFTITGGRNGINVLRGASVLIEGNTIADTGAARQPGSGLGINVAQHSFATIVKNTITNNPRAGILVHESSSARIGFGDVAVTGLGNVIQKNGREGILLQRASTARIVGNTIRNNGGDGVSLEQSSHAEISDNVLEENAGNGIGLTERSGVNLELKATGGPVSAPPNRTAAAAPNKGVGIHCSAGGYVIGALGSLNGARGAKALDSTCIDNLATP
jgi:parallel beta-helix repeat protein